MTRPGPRSASAAPRSLADDLRARSDEELVALLRARPDLVTPVPVDVAQLAARATTRASAVRALDRLDRFTLQVVDALAVLPEPVGLTGIRSLLGVGAAEVRGAIDHLRTLGLVYGGERSLRLVRVVRELVGPHPAGLGPPARQALGALSPSRLARLAADLGLEPSGDPMTDVLAVADVLADAARLETLLREAGPEAQAAARSLAGGPPTGRVDAARRDVHLATARTPVDRLLARGLLVPVDETTVLLPYEVGLHLRGGRLYERADARPPTPTAPVRDPALVDRTAGAGAAELVRRVETLLEAWAEEPPAVLRTGGLGVRDLRRLPPLLDCPEPEAALVADLAYAAGLVAPGGGVDEVWLPTPAYDAWRRDDIAARWRLLARTWLDTSRVAGLVGGRDDKDRPVAPLGRDLDRPLAPEVRRLVLEVLDELPAGSAPAADAVLEAVRWHRPRRGGALRDDLVAWTVGEAEALGVTGLGALSRAGHALLADDAAAADAALDAVLPEPLGHVLLQADLTAVAPGPLRSDLARELGLMADLESRGGASVHRFSADSVRRALDAGRSAADVHGFLARVSRTPVPQPLSYLVDDVARRHGLLRVGGAGSFVRCDDDAVLAEILVDPRSAALGLRRLAPTVLAAEVGPALLLDRLRRLGYAPAPEAPDGSVFVARAEPRRASARPAPEPLRAERPVPGETLLAAAVRAVRAGDRASASRLAEAAPSRLGRSASGQTLAALRAAAEAGTSVWIGYVDHHGSTSERVVDPVRVEGGWLTAYDHRSGEVRSFAAHRITGVAQAEPSRA